METDRQAYMTRAEFCKRVGITQETLRHYVEKGLIRPAKHVKNRYQLFSAADAAIVFSVREMRSLNLSLESIAEGMQHAGMEGFERSVSQREHELTVRQNEIQRELNQIRYQRSVCNACRTSEGRKPKLEHYQPSICAYYDGTPQEARRVRELAERFPYSYGALKFPLHPGKDDPPFQMGMLLPAHAISPADPLDISQYQQCARMRVVAGFDVQDLSAACAQDFLSVVDYAQRHNYRVVGDIIVVVHHVYRTGDMVGGVVTAGVGVEELD